METVRQIEPVFRQTGKGGCEFLQEELATTFPSLPKYRFDLANGFHNLARLLRDTGRFQEAEQLLRRAVDLNKELAASSPAVPEYRQRIGGALVALGEIMERTGRPREAEEIRRQTLQIFLNLQSEFPT